MSHWTQKKLDDITNIKGGKRLPKGEQLITEKTSHPYIRAQDIRNKRITFDDPHYITEEIYTEIERYTVEKEDVVLTIVGAGIGEIGIVPNKLDGANLTENAVKLIDLEDVDPQFLFYALLDEHAQSQIYNLAAGAAQPKLGIYKVKRIEIPYPDLKTQKGIASILTAFDDLIENNSRRIEILEEMARRIYREWFVHFRYPGHENDVLVDSGTDEFDTVPEKWAMQVMDEILKHYIGGTWGQEEPEGEENNPAYVIRGTDIPGGRSGNVYDIPLRYHKQSYINSRKLQHGDIIFEVSGGSKNQPVGRAMLITDTFLSELDCDDVVHASFCKLLRSDDSILKPEILYLHIREIYDDRRIMKYQVQSTGITNFKFTFFAENKRMFIPPMDLQEKFQKKVSPLFKQMYILGKKNNRLKKIRDLLLPKLISGKIETGEVTIN